MHERNSNPKNSKMNIKVLIIDNYDSFVYNLYQYVGEMVTEVLVRRNKIGIGDVRKINPDAIIISPGPGEPRNAGNTVKIIEKFYEETPIFGVCLGHQAIAYAFGSKIVRAKKVMHGKTSRIIHDGKSIYVGMKNPFIATRYHSLVVAEETLPNELIVTSKSLEDDEIMGIRHREYLVEGVQFHPESILTSKGKTLIKNFLKLVENTTKN